MDTTILKKIDELATPVFYTALFGTLTIMLLLETSGFVLALALIPLVSSLIAIKVFMSQVLKETSDVDACAGSSTLDQLAECNA